MTLATCLIVVAPLFLASIEQQGSDAILERIRAMKSIGGAEQTRLGGWLSSEDPRVRRAATAKLLDAWQSRSPAAYGTLKAAGRKTTANIIGLLEDPSTPARTKERGLNMLRYLGADAAAAVPVLDRLLDDERYKTMAIRALTGIGDPAVPLLRRLASGERKTKLYRPMIFTYLTMMMRPVPTQLVPVLEQAAFDADPQVGRMIVSWVAQRGAKALPLLYRYLEKGNEYLQRSALERIEALGQSQPVRLGPIFDLLTSDHERVVRGATYALRRFCDYRKGAYRTALVRGWQKVARDGPIAHRKLALGQLTRLATAQPSASMDAGALLGQLGTGPESVSIAAAKAISRHPAAVETLTRAYGEKPAALRRAWIVVALGYCGEKAVTSLASALADPDELVRWRAIIALKRLGKSALPALRAALRSTDAVRVEAALEAIARMRVSVARPVRDDVRALQNHSDTRIRDLAARIHAKLGK